VTGTLPDGLEFLLFGAVGTRIFCPEDFSSEQRQIADVAEGFIKKELLPNFKHLESQDFAFVVAKLRECAGLGLFLIEVPEEDGGLELDKATSMLLSEKMGITGSFSITFGGQSGIGLLPLVYYGTPHQKEQYLEKLTSGEWIAAYALTEPDSGSDPLSARTTARLSDDGRFYLLNGVKQFITNATFADLFTLFAKIDGKYFSAFLVERQSEGLSVGPEEIKMGLKGSSTAQVVLQDVRVPVGNLLGEAGKGHKIAFNVLNIGRLKLAATVTGMAKGAFAEAALYAAERKQFGRIIGEFGAIREKLADMTAAIFVSESVLYRVAGLIDERIATLDRTGGDYQVQCLKSIEEYAGECAIAKVCCTDILAGVVDEVVQVHGGYGYISEYPAERYYRDERIQRIFEGTNEINRILIATLLFRRAEAGTLDLSGTITDQPWDGSQDTGSGQFATEFRLLTDQKGLFRELLDTAAPARESQEILLTLADMIIAIFALESVLLRADKVFGLSGTGKRDLLEAAVKVAAVEVAFRFHHAASRCCAYTYRGDALVTMMNAISGGTVYPVEGLLESKRLLADASLASGKYII
jgi:alkylation response protein AidB-like acyl-CoA dehydrogenase